MEAESIDHTRRLLKARKAAKAPKKPKPAAAVTYKKTYRVTKVPAASYTYKYSTYTNPTAKTNKYYNSVTLRTYQPLVGYYHVVIYNPLGYYSPMYHTIYYDGYGYNFYYGGYGYYEHSVVSVHHTSSGGTIVAVVIVIALLCCCVIACRKVRRG